MILQKIKITGLFDQFDYEIELNQEEKITILTAPNGYGKTMILNIIHKLFGNFAFEFYKKITFSKIEYFFDKNYKIVLTKPVLLEIHLYHKNNIISSFTSIDDVQDFDFSQKSPEVYQALLSYTTYLIKEQRLIALEYNKGDISLQLSTINEHSKNLSLKIDKAQNTFLKISQELDSSFPTRLLSKKSALSKEDFNARFLELQNKQKKLKKHGLYSNNQEVPSRYDKENAKVLSIYLEDSEHKLNAFDSLLNRLELFTDILNNRRLLFKQIKINTIIGFEFYTNKGERLESEALSSGEQHQVVLLYELIFNAKPKTLVLIDEPEISLHVVWQKEFLNDLKKIIQLNDIHVLLATHSPQIINNDWELTVDLEEQRQTELA